MADIYSILSIRFLNNTIESYIVAVIVFFCMLILLRVVKFIFIHRFRKLAIKTKNRFDDVIVEAIDVHWPFFILLSLYVASKYLFITGIVAKVINYTAILVLAFYVVRGINKFVEYSTKHVLERNASDEDSSFIEMISIGARAVVWILAILFVMSNMGINISTLIAGLGIGGIAIAFALQNVLSDLFASFSIYLDKPFKPGDFVIVGTDMGFIRKTGIKSTRIKTLEGQELVVSNKELTETRVNNYKKMKRRRVVFKFGVTYQTSSKNMKKILDIVKEIVDKIEIAELDRVHWKNYDDSALTFEVVYYVNDSDYLLYMDTQQEINFKLKERLEKIKVDFAYPTRTIFLEK